MFHHQATRPISELRYLSDIDLTINSFDHQKDSPIIHRHSKRLEFVADNQDGRGWMEKKKREKNETRKEKDTNNIGRMEREIRCVLSLSVFHFPLLHTPPLPLLRPLMRRSLSWPSSLRRISLTIGGGIYRCSLARRREQLDQLLLHWETRYFDYQRKTNGLNRVGTSCSLGDHLDFGVGGVFCLFGSSLFVLRDISSKLYCKERILVEDRGCLLWKKKNFWETR